MPLFEKYTGDRNGKDTRGNNKVMKKMKKKFGNNVGKIEGKNANATVGLEPSKEAKQRMFSKKKNA